MEQAHWGQHRWLLKGGSPELYVSAASSYARAASATHAYYDEMGRTDEDAEHTIFTARMDADMTPTSTRRGVDGDSVAFLFSPMLSARAIMLITGSAPRTSLTGRWAVSASG